MHQKVHVQTHNPYKHSHTYKHTPTIAAQNIAFVAGIGLHLTKILILRYLSWKLSWAEKVIFRYTDC